MNFKHKKTVVCLYNLYNKFSKYEGWVRYFDWRYFSTSFLIELDPTHFNLDSLEAKGNC